MAKRNPYLEGYTRGRDEAKQILAQDLIGVYGAMCLNLKKRGWKDETVMSLMKSIQDTWNEVIQNGDKMVELVKRELGIDIEQMIVGVDDGKEK